MSSTTSFLPNKVPAPAPASVVPNKHCLMAIGSDIISFTMPGRAWGVTWKKQ